MFFNEWVEAEAARGEMKRIAAELGYPKSVEIFPKQVTQDGDKIGSWIHLPLHGALNGAFTTYLFRSDGRPRWPASQATAPNVEMLAEQYAREMSGMWKRSDAPVTGAPPDERGGNRQHRA